jgi:predicted nuclease of predicted toxin-antitoxin system
LRFIVDECCHRVIALALREAGHDVLYIAENDRRASDETIVGMAVDGEWVVVTADYDFGELAVRHRLAIPGVVLLAPTKQPVALRVRRLVSLVADLGDRLHGSLTIREDDRVRFRPLP